MKQATAMTANAMVLTTNDKSKTTIIKNDKQLGMMGSRRSCSRTVLHGQWL